MSNRDQVVSIASLLSDIPKEQPNSTQMSISEEENHKCRSASKHTVHVDTFVNKSSLTDSRKRNNSSSSTVIKTKRKLGAQQISPQEMALNLRTRLQYAKLKLENGWESQSLARLESRNNLFASQPSINCHYSMSTTTTPVNKNPSVSLNTSPMQKHKDLSKIVKSKTRRRTTSASAIDFPKFSPNLLQKNYNLSSLEPVSTTPISFPKLLTPATFSKCMNTGSTHASPHAEKLEKDLPGSSPPLTSYSLSSLNSFNDNQFSHPLPLVNKMDSTAAGQRRFETHSAFDPRYNSQSVDKLLNHEPEPSQSRIQDLLN